MHTACSSPEAASGGRPSRVMALRMPAQKRLDQGAGLVAQFLDLAGGRGSRCIAARVALAGFDELLKLLRPDKQTMFSPGAD